MKNKHRIKQGLALLLAGGIALTNLGAVMPAFAEDAPATPENAEAVTPETAEADTTAPNLVQITENLYNDLPDAPTGSYLGSMGLPVATGETKIGISAWVSDLYDGVDAHMDADALNADENTVTIGKTPGTDYAIVPLLAQVEYPADGAVSEIILPEDVELLSYLSTDYEPISADEQERAEILHHTYSEQSAAATGLYVKASADFTAQLVYTDSDGNSQSKAIQVQISEDAAPTQMYADTGDDGIAAYAAGPTPPYATGKITSIAKEGGTWLIWFNGQEAYCCSHGLNGQPKGCPTYSFSHVSRLEPGQYTPGNHYANQVNIGKTLAYLVACVLWQMNRPERMKLPIVISTSGVALQDAIINDYLPNLSAILLEERIIQAPLAAVIRKGKERFVCDARLAERASLVHPKRTREKRSLRIAENILDMDHIPELSRYDRCRICVPQSCPRDCFMRLDCRYQQYLRDSMKPDIQICNHNYLLADASHRLEDRPLLLRSYQALVVDEAHKLPDAARQMYTETLSSRAMDELCLLLQQAHYKDFARQLRTAFLTLSFSCTQGLSKLRGKASEPFVLTPFSRAALIDCIALLQNAGGLPDVPRYLLNRLGEAESLLRLFLLEVPTRILYIDYDADGQPTFCAASSRVPQLLRSALWNTREPAILTSGTLAAAGDFSHTEQLLGLAAYRPLRHFRADSPFDYKKKCLLYFSPRVKTRMDNRKMAEEIVRLVGACHGHALVLFTSYRQMAEVRALTDGQWQYPTYQSWRNGGKIIRQFKQSGNGVLFAAGSCWEGIDFPGDMVSLLIIAKLPFPIPDPVSDYERRQYPNLRDYINAEVIPEMQKKLRQGFGRAIRTEQDSCVVAILDERAGIGGKYHDAALAALPTCPTTEKIEDVQQFIREQKRPDYFL